MKIKHKFFFYTKITFCLILTASCQNKSKTLPEDKYRWEAGISSPKYYPVAGNVDFDGYAGNGSNVSFDSGWGNSHSAVVSGDKYKNIPSQVYIEYYSIVDVKDFKGTVALPKDKILALFKKYCKDKKNDSGNLVVGMAPGGWIRVWADFTGFKNGITLIEVAKAQLKEYDSGRKRDPITYEDWQEYYLYWEHFGIPYDAWAENEKEYNIYLNLSNPNPKYDVFSDYSSRDGTYYFGDWKDDSKMIAKLPADLIIGWRNKNDTIRIGYDTHILMPKNFSKIVKDKKTDKIEIVLEIEKNEQYGIFYLIANNKKEKILRFKNISSIEGKPLGYNGFCKDIEYFMK